MVRVTPQFKQHLHKLANAETPQQSLSEIVARLAAQAAGWEVSDVLVAKKRLGRPVGTKETKKRGNK